MGSQRTLYKAASHWSAVRRTVSNMLLDSSKMEKLRKHFADKDDFHVPFSVLLERVDKLAGEVAHLEALIASPLVSDEQRKEWVGSLLSDDPGQIWGAWFEIKLFSWLQ